MPFDSLIHKPSLSTLVLQVIIHYNALFSVLYAILVGVAAVNKLYSFEFHTTLQKYVLLPIFVVWLVTEPFRLYFGYSGNLQEKVSHVVSYLLISVFPQLPLVVYLAYLQEITFPMDFIMGSIMLIFLILDIFFGVRMLRSLIRSQTAQFRRICEAEAD